MANEQNLRPGEYQLTKEEAKKGGKASGEARRRKRDLKQRMKALMELQADPKIAAALEKTGVEVNDNLDVLMASIMKGVLKGDPRMIQKALELSEQDPQAKAKAKAEKLELEKLKLENERLKLENEKQQIMLNAYKGIGQDELPDDGFLTALEGTAEEDWNNETVV